MGQEYISCKTNGVHHAGLSVRCLDEAGHLLMDTPGYKIVGEKPEYPAVFDSNLLRLDLQIAHREST